MDIKGIFKKDYVVGLDIGSFSVKLVQFAKKEGGLDLIKVGMEEIAHAEDEASREEQILSALRVLLDGIDIKKSEFIVSINCPRTAARRVTAPYMPKGELGQAIRLEAKNYFPFSVKEASLDFEILGDVFEEGVKKYQILVATSPKETVSGYLSLLSKVDIKPASFIPAPYSLEKLVNALPPDRDQINCSLDIGERHTELAIFKEGSLIFSRKIPVAGADFTKAMTGTLVSDRGKIQLSLDEAEQIKRKVGIPPEAESRMIADKISTTQILSMLRPPLEQLANEINRCFDYYREEAAGEKINSLALFGGGASLKGIAGFLSKELGMEVKLGNPLEGLKLKSDITDGKAEVLHQIDLATGAGLSEGRGINLLPPEIKEEAKRTFKRTTFETAVTATVLILAFLYIGMRIQLSNFRKRIPVARMELSSLGPQLKQAGGQSQAYKILADEPYWEDVFKELGNTIPNDIYLTELSMENKTIKIRGLIVSEEKERLLSDFIRGLERGIFKNVKLVTTKETKEKATNEFELKCWVD